MTTLERFIELGEIQIGPNPLVPGYNRLLVMSGGMHWFPTNREITLRFQVYYIDENGQKMNKESLKDYGVPLTADQYTKLDISTLAAIPNPGERPREVKNSENEITNQAELDLYDAAKAVYDAAPTEYDVFKNQMNADVNVYQKQLEIILFRASAQGGSKFDI